MICRTQLFICGYYTICRIITYLFVMQKVRLNTWTELLNILQLLLIYTHWRLKFTNYQEIKSLLQGFTKRQDNLTTQIEHWTQFQRATQLKRETYKKARILLAFFLKIRVMKLQCTTISVFGLKPIVVEYFTIRVSFRSL